ncbi:hypothetical protein BASA83_008212 [Batrachochytrium salamandrivorans]|nr:hypothetical protein BASA83_008212 [Batrachochytrium salamandrivorans]
MLVSSVIALLTISTTSVSAYNYITYNLLSDDRAAGRLVFPPTTLAQKDVILSNVENALAIWVNYKSKIAHYGPAADPFPTIKNLRRDIKTITDEELQLGITDAFVLIRDKHTSWTNMAPYRCFHATTGIKFSFIKGDPDITKSPLWFKQNKFKSGAGANVFGGHRAALDYLTTIYGKTNRLPSEDFITFKFKSRTNPQNSYTVNVQYVSGRNEDCWELGSKLYKSLPSITLPGAPVMSLLVSAEQSGHSQESDTAHLSPESHKMDSPENSEREADIEKRSSFGQESVFRSKDVETNSLAVQKAVMIIRSLLANELKDTHSVMYELRGNSGGDVRFANSMVQLFKPDFQPFGERYLMNKITFDLFVEGRDPNGHGAGVIFGEDKRTGGGGAIVMKLDPALILGVTQFVRTGRYKGQTFEDVGIETDTVVRPQWSDLELYPTTNTQYDRIAEHLARIGLENGQSKLHFVCEPFLIEKPINGFSLEVETAGIEKLTVLQADGKTVAAQQKVATTKQKLSIPVSTVGSALGNSHITIVGKTAGKQVLKTIRNVRIIPSDENHMKISTTGFTFAGTSDSVGLYQPSTTAPADGWNNLKGPWMIGNGVKYAKNVESCLEAFFTASVGTKINIGLNVDLDTEFDSDFLYLSVKSSGGVEDFLISSESRYDTKTFNGISGREMLFEGTFPFTTKSKKFSVALKFTSNDIFEFTGVTINSFTVSAA